MVSLHGEGSDPVMGCSKAGTIRVLGNLYGPPQTREPLGALGITSSYLYRLGVTDSWGLNPTNCVWRTHRYQGIKSRHLHQQSMQELGISSNSCPIQNLAGIWGLNPNTCPLQTLQISGHHFQISASTIHARIGAQSQSCSLSLSIVHMKRLFQTKGE